MSDILVVFQAEFLRRIRSRPFIAGLVIGALALFVMLRLPAIMDSVTVNEVHKMVLVGNPAVTERAKTLLSSDYQVVATVPSASDYRSLLTKYNVGQAVVFDTGRSGIGVTVYARDPANVAQTRIQRDLLPLRLAQATKIPQAQLDRTMTLPVEVRSTGTRFATSDSAQAAHAIVFLMVFALYIVTLVNSQLVMSSVAEEKTSRIAEMLVAAIDPSRLLVGKILASAALAFLQLAVWIAFAVGINGLGTSDVPGSTASASASGLDLNAALGVITVPMIVLFAVLFLIGLLQLTTMFAGVASMINRTEDIGSLTGPLIIPVVFALMASITALDVPDAKWAVICSFIPIVSPFVLFARVAVSNVPAMQIALALLVNVIALLLTALAAGKVYRVGMLLYGRAPSFFQVWRALRS